MKNPYVNLIKTVWHFGKPWRATIVGYYIAFIIAQTAIGLSPYTFARTVDVLQHFQPNRFREVIFWLLASVAALICFWLFHGPARVVERNVALKIQQALRLNLYTKLTHLPLTWHQNHHTGNLITRFNRASVALHQFAETQYIYIEAIVQFLVAIGFLCWVSLSIGLVTLSASIFVAGTILYFDKKLIPLYNEENEIDNRVGAILFDYISNMTTVLTLRLGTLTYNNLYKRIMSVWPYFRKEAVINEVKWFLMGISLSLVQASVLIGYIYYSLKQNNYIAIGLVVMIFRYQIDLTSVFKQLSVFYSELVRLDTDIAGLKPIWKDIDALAEIPVDSKISPWQNCQISNLTFNHINDNQEKIIFKNLNLQLKRGEKIALIGPSGVGKSTLLNVISGLYKATSTTLTLDKKTYQSLKPLQLFTTLIPQDPEIFENTVEFNITLDLTTSKKEIEKVAELAEFTSILATLPHGFKTDIREKGLNLSVGQKQRLALARGLFAARFSSLILMDEPTSSVDLKTEKLILSNILNYFTDATMIISLHRLHLLPQFDSVILLGPHGIITQGSTQELLNTPGPVQDLWQNYRKE